MISFVDGIWTSGPAIDSVKIHLGWSTSAYHKVNIHTDKEEILAAACDYRIGGGFLVLTEGPLSPHPFMCCSSPLLLYGK
jgi:hypothetical protein